MIILLYQLPTVMKIVLECVYVYWKEVNTAPDNINKRKLQNNKIWQYDTTALQADKVSFSIPWPMKM